MEFFSPAQENKRPAVALQLELFSPLQFGLFQSYEVEWRTCRVNLQLGFAKPYRIKGLQMVLQPAALQSRMMYLQSGSAVWTFSVLQRRIKGLQTCGVAL